MNPSSTLREIAKIASNPVVKEQLEQLAAEFETQHNNQNNQWAITMGRIQNTWEQGLDDLRRDLTTKMEQIEQAVGDLSDQSNTRDGEILRRLDDLLKEIRNGNAPTT